MNPVQIKLVDYDILLVFKNMVESIGNKLTSLGLEVEGITKFESIPGGLEGVVVGKTQSIKKHPNADAI